MFTNSPAEKREKSEDTPHNYSGRMMVNLLLIRPYFRGGGLSSLPWGGMWGYS